MAAWDLTFLGTGSAYPSPHRGASCMILRHGHHVSTSTKALSKSPNEIRLHGTFRPRMLDDLGCWVFDCGEGSQIQLMRSSIKHGKITKIFITHLHGDHVYGLPGLMCTLSASLAEDSPPLEVYGPTGLRQFVRVALNFARSQLCYQYVVHELHHNVHPAEYDGLSDWTPDHSATGQTHPKELLGRNIERNSQGFWDICRDGSLTVRAATLKHRVVSFGYVITEDTLPGKLLVDKLKSLGVPPGPLYSQIKRGVTIESPQGIKISPEDVTGPSRPGRKVVILGDTCDNSDIAPLCMDADVVVHEATNENAHEQQCRENGHSTPGMAATFCHSVRASQLILTHFSQRYRPPNSEGEEDSESVDKLVIEAQDTLTKIETETETSTVLRIKVSAADDLKMYKILAKK